MAAKSATVVLTQFFGYRTANPQLSSLDSEEFKRLSYGERVMAGGLRGFMVELHALTNEEKLELARLAAKAMSLTQEQVDFPLE